MEKGREREGKREGERERERNLPLASYKIFGFFPPNATKTPPTWVIHNLLTVSSSKHCPPPSLIWKNQPHIWTSSLSSQDTTLPWLPCQPLTYILGSTVLYLCLMNDAAVSQSSTFLVFFSLLHFFFFFSAISSYSRACNSTFY